MQPANFTITDSIMIGNRGESGAIWTVILVNHDHGDAMQTIL